MRKLTQHEVDQIVWNANDARRQVDLSNFDLAGRNLIGANLRGANLVGADLVGTNLRRANLEGANLRGTNLRGAYLRGTNLIGANLRGAILVGTGLEYANLEGVDLRGTNLEGADLKGVNLEGVKLNWNSHQLIGELLIQASINDSQEMLGLFVQRKTGECWNQWLVYDHPERDWAINTLKQWAKDNDNTLPSKLEDYE